MIVPPSDRLLPERTSQVYAGLYSDAGDQHLSAGAYYKKLSNLVYFADASKLFDSAIAGWEENIEVGAYLSSNSLDIDDLLQTLGLYEHRHKLPNQLSGGQQQRVSIGRAIVKNPDILLCDEPTGALDYKTSKEILKLIEEVNQKYGNTVIMVTHNDAIKNMADFVVKLRDGVIRKSYRNENKMTAEELDW